MATSDHYWLPVIGPAGTGAAVPLLQKSHTVTLETDDAPDNPEVEDASSLPLWSGFSCIR
jgi:hypothetical protein